MTMATENVSSSVSVVKGLYLRTKSLHTDAERSGIINDMLRGNASKDDYILLMRNLLPAYQEMEQGFERHLNSSRLAELASYKLDRASTIKSDLHSLVGSDWEEKVPLLEAGNAYAARVAEAANGDGMKLIAHAYTRYLGDLSGGLILQKILMRAPGLKPSEMSFYNFPQFSDLALLKSDYRAALDRAGNVASDPDSILEEGAAAFSLNIDLSWAVKNATSAEAAE